MTPESIGSNARYWGGEDQVPPQALTCGMDAKTVYTPERHQWRLEQLTPEWEPE